MNRLGLAGSKASCTMCQQPHVIWRTKGLAAMFLLPVCVVTDPQVVRCLTFL